MKAPTLVAAALLGGASAHVHRRGHEIFHKRTNDTEVCLPGCTTTYTTITGDFIWQPTPNAPAKVATSSSSSAVATGASSVTVTNSVTPAASTAAVASSAPAVSAPASSAPASSAAVPSAAVPSAAVPSSAVPSSAVPSSAVSSAAAVSVPVASAASTPAVVPTPIAQTISTPGTYTFPATTLTLTETTSVVAATTTEVPSGTYTLGGVTTVVETATTVVCPFATVSTQTGGVVTSVIETTTYVCPAAGTYTIAPTTVTVTAATETVTVPVVSTYLPGTYTAPAVTTVITTETVVWCPFAASEGAGATTTSVAEPTTSSVVEATATPSVVDAATSSAGATSSAAALTAGVGVGVGVGVGASVSGVVGATASVSVGISVGVAASSASTTLIAPSASVAYSSSSTSTSTSTSTAASSTSTATLGSSTGSQWAMTYTPYDSDSGDCKTSDVVDADVASIKSAGFDVLRVYSTDCDTLTNVGAAAAKYGVRMITGIFISEVGCANGSPDVDDQISALKEWARWDLVELLTVGNEALYDGYCTAQELVDLIAHVRAELPGYTGPYTTTDIVAAWQEAEVQDLVCGAVDVVAANVHSYFSADTPPADAGDFVKGQIEIVEAACGGAKKGYVLECGYPTSGATNGVNVPSVANQQIAITSIREVIGDRVVFFSMFNDKWKEPGTCECEQYWGVGTLFGALGLGDGE